MDTENYVSHIKEVLEKAVAKARPHDAGKLADYIPELACVNEDYLSATIRLADGDVITAGDDPDQTFTMQSVSKIVPLIGLLEEFGPQQVFSWIDVEPSGQPFSSISQLERFGPVPSNPLVNSGAIALTAHIPGNCEEQKKWLDNWLQKLFNSKLEVDFDVFNSELKHGHRNRSLAYLMKSTGVLKRDVEETLKTYFMLCSYKLNIEQSSYIAMLLANGGLAPDGSRVFSEVTSNCVVSILATCGMYDESGKHLVRTGLPAKSGVSGLIIAIATGRAGIAVQSPKLNNKGGSVRGHIILAEISQALDWHFAAPWGFARLDSKLHEIE